MRDGTVVSNSVLKNDSTADVERCQQLHAQDEEAFNQCVLFNYSEPSQTTRLSAFTAGKIRADFVQQVSNDCSGGLKACVLDSPSDHLLRYEPLFLSLKEDLK